MSPTGECKVTDLESVYRLLKIRPFLYTKRNTYSSPPLRKKHPSNMRVTLMSTRFTFGTMVVYRLRQ